MIGVWGLIMHGNRSLQRHVEAESSRKLGREVQNGKGLDVCGSDSGALQVGPRDNVVSRDGPQRTSTGTKQEEKK
jgi:hypothetical protein